jgi:hypothetical protein
MSRHYVFADEAGCFTFERKQNVSKYFILCTVTMATCEIAHDLLSLRRDLAWAGVELHDYFHATEDSQEVRNAVFETILKREFRVQAQIMEKSKAQPHVRSSKARFYKHAWFFQFKHGTSKVIPYGKDTLITAASIGNKKEKLSFTNAIDDVMKQTMHRNSWKTDFRSAASDGCLQVADYCAWAIQRKWERGDTRSYESIKKRITYEYDFWSHGTQHYY